MQISGVGGCEGKKPPGRRWCLTCESAAPAGGTGERRGGWRSSPERPRSRTATTTSSWHLLVLPPSERATGSGRREPAERQLTRKPRGSSAGRGRPLLLPHPAWAARWAAFRRLRGRGGGLRVKFTVSGGGRACGGGVVSPLWHTLP